MSAVIKKINGEPVVLLCCSQEQLDLWSHAARLSQSRTCLETFCSDCEASFRARHEEAGLCVSDTAVAEAE